MRATDTNTNESQREGTQVTFPVAPISRSIKIVSALVLILNASFVIASFISHWALIGVGLRLSFWAVTSVLLWHTKLLPVVSPYGSASGPNSLVLSQEWVG